MSGVWFYRSEKLVRKKEGVDWTGVALPRFLQRRLILHEIRWLHVHADLWMSCRQCRLRACDNLCNTLPSHLPPLWRCRQDWGTCSTQHADCSNTRMSDLDNANKARAMLPSMCGNNPIPS